MTDLGDSVGSVDEFVDSPSPRQTPGVDIEMQSLSGLLAGDSTPTLIYLNHRTTLHTTEFESGRYLLTPERIQQLLPVIPARNRGIKDLECVYSLTQCGASLSDLYRRMSSSTQRHRGSSMSDDAQGSLMIIRDDSGYIFGCYASHPWHRAETYYGNASCFLFRLLPDFRVYPAAAASPSSPSSVETSNEFFQFSNDSSLALGGGNHFAIWMDEALRKGVSKPCHTFGSEMLSAKEEFIVTDLEVWSFVEKEWQ